MPETASGTASALGTDLKLGFEEILNTILKYVVPVVMVLVGFFACAWIGLGSFFYGLFGSIPKLSAANTSSLAGVVAAAVYAIPGMAIVHMGSAKDHIAGYLFAGAGWFMIGAALGELWGAWQQNITSGVGLLGPIGAKIMGSLPGNTGGG